MLKVIDKYFCKYLGLNRDSIRLDSLKKKDTKFIVKSTMPFKRHLIHEQWNNFEASSFKELNKKDYEKLGIAAGKAIAKNLVISFEGSSIDKSKIK
ncbi:MAG: hypothetical protein WAW84_06865 [Candidatus Rickettsiella isopodorum]|jgi:hypothetical protein